MVLRPLEEGWRRPEEAVRLRRRRDGGGVVVGEEARLQLADPVPAGGERQARIRLQMLLEPLLVEPGVVEGAEDRGQAAQRPDQLELPGDPVDDETEPRLAREVEPGLGLPLHLVERIAAGEKVRDQVGAAIGRIGEIAGLLRRVEGAPHQAAAGADVLRPGNDVVPEDQVDAGLEAIQPALLHQVEAELAEAERGLVVAELRPQHGAEHDIGIARRVAVAMLQAEIRHAADDEAVQILVGEQGRRHDRGEDVHGRAPDRVGHPRQVEQRLDRAVPDLLPHPLVLLPDLLLRRVRRPRDADAPQVVEGHLDAAVAPVRGS